MEVTLERITGILAVKGHDPINYEYYIKTRTMIFGLGSEKLSSDTKDKIYRTIQVAVENTPEKVISYE